MTRFGTRPSYRDASASGERGTASTRGWSPPAPSLRFPEYCSAMAATLRASRVGDDGAVTVAVSSAVAVAVAVAVPPPASLPSYAFDVDDADGGDTAGAGSTPRPPPPKLCLSRLFPFSLAV